MAEVCTQQPTTSIVDYASNILPPSQVIMDSKDAIDLKPVDILTPPGEIDSKLKMSPSTTNGSPVSSLAPTMSHVPRRPHRKSTLTQQQKNMKRQRATQEQLTTLEVEFNKNPTPTAAIREKIADDINMTERSVQIWFQNRRAKIKNLAKKSIESGEDCDAIPESMRRYLAMQAMESGKPLAGAELFINGGLGHFGGPAMNPETPASKVLIHHITCRSLTIGTWSRIGQTQLDLVVFYCPTKSMMTYYISADSRGFRIEYPFSFIKTMTLDTGDVSNSAEGAMQQSGGIVIELNHPPIFTLEGSEGWFQCADFTENQQATNILTHHLGGNAKVLSTQMAKLVSLESYRMRHSAFDNTVTNSAPVSPAGLHRPASQPNHLVHPYTGMFQQNGTAFDMGPPAPRGHKRQRSRSVPVAIDFSQRHQPLPDFMVHHSHQHHHVHHHSPLPNGGNSQNHIYAPIPQHAPPVPYQQSPPMFGVVNPGLSIDTAATFPFDFTMPPGPSSATTATTPPSSEFESNYYPQNRLGNDALSAPQIHTPYSAPFLSPLIDPSGLLHPSVSPLSAMSQPDQSVNESSPGYFMYRSASADPSTAQHDLNSDNKVSDYSADSVVSRERPAVYDADASYDEKSALDALLVDDPLVHPFSKQPLTLPFRMPNEEMSQQQHFSIPNAELSAVNESNEADDFEFYHLVRLDPSSASPEEEKTSFLP